MRNSACFIIWKSLQTKMCILLSFRTASAAYFRKCQNSPHPKRGGAGEIISPEKNAKKPRKGA